MSRFVLIGREKLNAVRAEIRAIEKVGLAQEVHQQKLLEAQEIAEAVLDAEMRIGELTAQIPKSTGGQPFHKSTIRTDAKSTKSETLKEIGIKKDAAKRFEDLARHPEAVEQAKAVARERGEVVTRSSVMQIIAANAPKPQKSNPVAEATIRHMEFKYNKVSTIQEAKQDDADRDTMARAAFGDIQSCICKITGIAALNDRNMIKRIAQVIDQKKRQDTVTSLRRCISVLSTVTEELNGG